MKLGDVIIVGRGGGSIEDLLPFSDEAVVRAIAASRIPVISAVGHEIDWALSDFAADLRAPTPSAAAELVSESREALEREIAQFKAELETAILSRLDRARLVIGRFEPSAVEARFQRVLMPFARRLDEAVADLGAGIGAALADRSRRVELSSRELLAMNPSAVLSRGFALVRVASGTGAPAAKGAAVRDAASLGIGDRLDITFSSGRAAAEVLEVDT